MAEHQRLVWQSNVKKKNKTAADRWSRHSLHTHQSLLSNLMKQNKTTENMTSFTPKPAGAPKSL